MEDAEPRDNMMEKSARISLPHLDSREIPSVRVQELSRAEVKMPVRTVSVLRFPILEILVILFLPPMALGQDRKNVTLPASLWKNRIQVTAEFKPRFTGRRPSESFACPCKNRYLWIDLYGHWDIASPGDEVRFDQHQLHEGYIHETQVEPYFLVCVPDTGILFKRMEVIRTPEGSRWTQGGEFPLLLQCKDLKTHDVRSMMPLEDPETLETWGAPPWEQRRNFLYTFAPFLKIKGRWHRWNVKENRLEPLPKDFEVAGCPEGNRENCFSQMINDSFRLNASLSSDALVYRLWSYREAEEGTGKPSKVCEVRTPRPEAPPGLHFSSGVQLRWLRVTGTQRSFMGVIYQFEDVSRNPDDTEQDVRVFKAVRILPVIDLLDLESCRWLARALSIKVPGDGGRFLPHSILFIHDHRFITSSGRIFEVKVVRSDPPET